MTQNGVPVRIAGAEVDEYATGPKGDDGFIRRLISRGNEGSSVLVGTFRLDPGQRGTFELPHPTGMTEETYCLLAGRLQVSWDGGRFVAEPGDAIFFPPGGRYEIETLGINAVELIWTGYPAPHS
jgi:ethanolamine utilization protein EutQ (cupin superfamily)